MKANQVLKIRPAIISERPAIELTLIEKRSGELFARTYGVFLHQEIKRPQLLALTSELLAADLHRVPGRDVPALEYSFIEAAVDVLPRLDRAHLESSFWQYARAQ